MGVAWAKKSDMALVSYVGMSSAAAASALSRLPFLLRDTLAVDEFLKPLLFTFDASHFQGCWRNILITNIIPATLDGPPVVREVILDCGRSHFALVKLQNKLQNLRKHNMKKWINEYVQFVQKKIQRAFASCFTRAWWLSSCSAMSRLKL